MAYIMCYNFTLVGYISFLQDGSMGYTMIHLLEADVFRQRTPAISLLSQLCWPHGRCEHCLSAVIVESHDTSSNAKSELKFPNAELDNG